MIAAARHKFPLVTRCAEKQEDKRPVRLATVHPGSTTLLWGAATANGNSDSRVETKFACHVVPMVLDAIQPNGQRCDEAMALCRTARFAVWQNIGQGIGRLRAFCCTSID